MGPRIEKILVGTLIFLRNKDVTVDKRGVGRLKDMANEYAHIYSIETIHIIAIIISIVFFAIMYVKAKRGPLLFAFFYVEGTMMLWMVAKVLKSVSPTVELRWSFIVLQYVGICLLEAAFLEFAYIYKTGKTLSVKARYIIHIMPMIQFIIIATNPYHHLFYAYYDFWGDEFGPTFYYHMVVEYSYIVVGIILCGIKLRKEFSKDKRWVGLLSGMAILLPLLFNIFYLTGNFNAFLKSVGIRVIFDVTPIAFSISLLLFIITIFKDSFFDLMPIMKHKIVSQINIPIVISSISGKMLDWNVADEGTFMSENKVEKVMRDYATCDEGNYNAIIEDRNYIVLKKRIKVILERYVYVFNDVTIQMKTKEMLYLKNIEIKAQNKLLLEKIYMLQKTSRIAAANYIARELHDVIGHALVLTIKLCESSKLDLVDDHSMAVNHMEYAVSAVKDGFKELKKTVIKDNNNSYTSLYLEKQLQEMIGKVDGIKVKIKFYFRGNEFIIEERKVEATIRIVQEGMTNALKYSEADTIIISVDVAKDGIRIYVVDNGIGCEKFTKGNGIKGMEQRIFDLNGEVTYDYGKGKGFQINVVI